MLVVGLKRDKSYWPYGPIPIPFFFLLNFFFYRLIVTEFKKHAGCHAHIEALVVLPHFFNDFKQPRMGSRCCLLLNAGEYTVCICLECMAYNVLPDQLMLFFPPTQ